MSRQADQHTSPRGRRHLLRPDLDMGKIAKRIGCSPSYLSDILHGRRRVTDGIAPKLAQALGLPVEYVASTITSWAARAASRNRKRNGRAVR